MARFASRQRVAAAHLVGLRVNRIHREASPRALAVLRSWDGSYIVGLGQIEVLSLQSMGPAGSRRKGPLHAAHPAVPSAAYRWLGRVCAGLGDTGAAQASMCSWQERTSTGTINAQLCCAMAPPKIPSCWKVSYLLLRLCPLATSRPVSCRSPLKGCSRPVDRLDSPSECAPSQPPPAEDCPTNEWHS